MIGLMGRQLGWRGFLDSGLDALRTGCMVIFIIAGATVFGHFMAVTKIPFLLAEWVGNLPIAPMALMGIIVDIYFVGGFFMDSMALIVVTIPIFFPPVQKLGWDPMKASGFLKGKTP